MKTEYRVSWTLRAVNGSALPLSETFTSLEAALDKVATLEEGNQFLPPLQQRRVITCEERSVMAWRLVLGRAA